MSCPWSGRERLSTSTRAARLLSKAKMMSLKGGEQTFNCIPKNQRKLIDAEKRDLKVTYHSVQKGAEASPERQSCRYDLAVPLLVTCAGLYKTSS